MSLERMLTVAELADRFGWSVSKIYRLLAAKRIPHVKLSGGGYYFREREIDEWLERQSVRPATMPAPSRSVRSRAEECRALGVEPDHAFS